MKDDAPQEIPESGLGDDFVWRKDAHAVYFGIRFRIGGEMATDDLVFLKSHLCSGHTQSAGSSTKPSTNPPADGIKDDVKQ